MVVRLAVSTIGALALLPARNTRSVALAVVLLARRFFARAFSPRHVGGNSREMARISIVCNSLGVVNSSSVVTVVAAAAADTLFAADPTLREALTVEFEAIDF
jgi:hypothetical protein